MNIPVYGLHLFHLTPSIIRDSICCKINTGNFMMPGKIVIKYDPYTLYISLQNPYLPISNSGFIAKDQLMLFPFEGAQKNLLYGKEKK